MSPIKRVVSYSQVLRLDVILQTPHNTLFVLWWCLINDLLKPQVAQQIVLKLTTTAVTSQNYLPSILTGHQYFHVRYKLCVAIMINVGRWLLALQVETITNLWKISNTLRPFHTTTQYAPSTCLLIFKLLFLNCSVYIIQFYKPNAWLDIWAYSNNKERMSVGWVTSTLRAIKWWHLLLLARCP